MTDEGFHQTMSDPQSSRAEATRARIEAVAERLFRTMGYQKTAVADIARELGMSPANIYRFYPSKSAINEAIAERLLGGMLEGAWAIARGSAPPPDRLRAMLRHLHAQHMALFYNERRLHDMVTAAMAEHWSVVERFIRGVVGALRHVLMDGMADGSFARLDADATAYLIKQAIMCVNHPALVSECMATMQVTEAQLAEQSEAMAEFILRALRP